MVRALAAKYDAVVAGIFVRASSGSGRLDLAPQLERFLQDIARATERRKQPFVSVLFGNPYTAMGMPEAPAVMLTYDFSDGAERAAVKALAGEIPHRRQAADCAAGAVPDRPRADALRRRPWPRRPRPSPTPAAADAAGGPRPVCCCARSSRSPRSLRTLNSIDRTVPSTSSFMSPLRTAR